MSAPDAVLQLIHKFEQNKVEYLAPHYNETQTRQEFIDPLFIALGWDVTNKHGLSADHKDVILEDEVKVERMVKAPDYGFYIDGRRRFFVEAKKPSAALSGKPGMRSAFQLRRYAWNAGLTISILTNFLEFSVYDGRVKPDAQDPVTTARIAHFSYHEYDDRWAEIADWLARESVAKGRIERYAEQKTKLRNVIPVDDAFLVEIESWRELLASNIVKMNPALVPKQTLNPPPLLPQGEGESDSPPPEGEGPGVRVLLTPRALNYAVQMTIDRLVFLRICEDRGIEPPGLFGTVNGGNTYARLMHVFRQADVRYNSGLFHFGKEAGREDQPDAFTPALHIDDEPLQQILRKLYDENSVYDFSQIPVEVLGNVYERFLGKVITLDANPTGSSGGVTVVEKPEVRKAGGVYYTPTYIVDYIVRHTVGALLEGKTPTEAAKLRIVDPACGSGSFLLGAYQFLLDWYREWYASNDPAAHPADVFYHSKGEIWRLTTARRRKILLDNLFGVDIDAQAVEVTKLSLLLRLLEGESEQSITRQLALFKQRALPDLNTNVKCGNSLIGYDAPEGTTDNPFDWKSEFSTVFKNGGFDAVIGNPPYVRIQTLRESAPETVDYYHTAYQAAGYGNYDLYVLFVEQGLRLLAPQGTLGFILPHKFFNAQYGQPIRQLVATGKHLSHVVHFGDQQVFKNATTYTAMMFLKKTAQDQIRFVKVTDLLDWRSTGHAPQGFIATDSVTGTEWNFTIGAHADLFDRLSKMPVKLGDIAEIFVGLQTSADDVFIMDFVNENKDTITLKSVVLGVEWEFEKGLLYPVVSGTDVARYINLPKRQFILFPYVVDNSKAELISFAELGAHYPKTAKYLLANKAVLEQRERGKFEDSKWYRFGRAQNLGIQERPKLCVPRLVKPLHAGYDPKGNYFLDNVDVGGISFKPGHENQTFPYLLAILNSKLMRYYFPSISAPFRGGFLSANKQFITQLPIRVINFADKKEKAQHDQIVTLVERMLYLHQQRAATLAPPDQTALDRQIAATDQQIDQAVYALYGLSAAEIALVEGI
jgi:predicted type IV restriction endonuclease